MLKVLDNATETEALPASPTLDDLAREGARRMLMAALQVEVAQYVEAHAGRLATRPGGDWSCATVKPRPARSRVGRAPSRCGPHG